MTPALAEDFNKQVRATIDYFWMIAKLRRGIHHSQNLDYIFYAIQIAIKRIAHGGDENEPNFASEPISFLNVKI